MDNFSGDDSDWEDEFPLSTLRLLNGDDIGSSGSDSDDDVPLSAICATLPTATGTSSSATTNVTPTPARSKVSVGTRKWIRVGHGEQKTPEIPEYDNSDCGITDEVDLGKTKSILDFFQLFFTFEFVTQLVHCTNNYAADSERQGDPASTGTQKAKARKWMPVNIDDIKQFLGLTLLMGLIRKPRIKDYWAHLAELATPFFRQVMPRDRFFQILR